jgi:hypothetical protein
MPRYSRSHGHGKVTCPVCFNEGYLEESCVTYEDKVTGEKTEYCYWRVVHYYKDADGKRRKVVHYYGPVDREYWRVNPIHRLGLRDLVSQNPLTIVRSLVYNLVSVARAMKGTRLARRYLEHARRLREYLAKEALPQLEELERELEEAEREQDIKLEASSRVESQVANEAQ